jgi:ribosomal protein L11 methylase PrmA
MTRWKSFTVEVRREAIDAVTRFLMERGSLGTAYDEQLLRRLRRPRGPDPFLRPPSPG